MRPNAGRSNRGPRKFHPGPRSRVAANFTSGRGPQRAGCRRAGVQKRNYWAGVVPGVAPGVVAEGVVPGVAPGCGVVLEAGGVAVEGIAFGLARFSLFSFSGVLGFSPFSSGFPIEFGFVVALAPGLTSGLVLVGWFEVVPVTPVPFCVPGVALPVPGAVVPGWLLTAPAVPAAAPPPATCASAKPASARLASESVAVKNSLRMQHFSIDLGCDS